MKKKNGFALASVLMITAILVLIIPALIQLIQRESKRSITEGKKTTAFHMAEAGQDRGVWKLRETEDMWNGILDGTPISGYNNDVTHTDDSTGGTYKISITSGPGLNQVTIVSKGKARGNSEI